MAASEIVIANEALALLGERRITSFEEGQRGELCEELYPSARDFVLRKYEWNCAKTQAKLTRQEYPGTGFSYQYILPTDCLRVLEAVPDDTVKRRMRGGKIVSNLESLEILYIKRIHDTSAFSPMLSQSIAARLAYLLAPTITMNPNLQSQMLALYQQTVLEARQEDAMEGFEAPEPEPRWEEAGR